MHNQAQTQGHRRQGKAWLHYERTRVRHSHAGALSKMAANSLRETIAFY